MPSVMARAAAAAAGLVLAGCSLQRATAFTGPAGPGAYVGGVVRGQPPSARLRRPHRHMEAAPLLPTRSMRTCLLRLNARGKASKTSKDGDDPDAGLADLRLADDVDVLALDIGDIAGAVDIDEESLDALAADMADGEDPFLMRGGGVGDEDPLEGLTEDDLAEQLVAQEVLRRFGEDAPVVLTDDMGNIIGGVDPYADPENELEPDEPNTMGENGEWPEVAGETGGMDDPPDAPWRREAEEIIRREVEATGLNCYDIMWSFHKLEITVTRGDLPEDSEEAGYVDSDALMKAIRAVNEALEAEEERLWVLGRHELIIATPGAKDILTTDREFKAFKGFDVVVLTGSTLNVQREITGKLHERTFDELTIMQKGRKVRIPLALVDEVRLPSAKVEPGEQWGL